MAMGLEEIASPEEVAKYLKVSLRTVYRYIEARKLRSSKIGKHYRIKKSALKEFIDKHER